MKTNHFRKSCLLMLIGCLNASLCFASDQPKKWKTYTIKSDASHRIFTFSPDSKLLFTQSYNGVSRLWNVNRGVLYRTLSPPEKYSGTQKVMDGKTLCSMANARLSDDANTYKAKDLNSLILQWNRNLVNGNGNEHVILSKDARLLAASRSAINFKTYDSIIGIDVWDVKRRKIIRSFNQKKASFGMPREYYFISFSPDKTMLFASCYFDYRSHTTEGPQGYTEMQLWNLHTGRRIPINQKVGDKLPNQANLSQLNFSLAGQQIAFPAGNKIYLVNTRTKVTRILSGHEGDITTLISSPDGNFLASSSADKTVRIWNVQSGLEEHTQTNFKDSIDTAGLAFSPDGKFLASSDGSIINFASLK